MFAVTYIGIFCVLLSTSPLVEGRQGDFLSEESIEADLQEATGIALGMTARRQPEIVKALAPIFNVLPKNAHNRIERPMLRYALHRYFQKQYSVVVRGLEPTQNAVSASALVTAEGIFRDRAPTFIEAVLEGRFFKKGFALEDAASIAAILEELVLEVPDRAIDSTPQSSRGLSRSELEAMLRGYVMQWMVSDDPDAQSMSDEEAEKIIPKWLAVKDFVRGEIDRLVHKRRQAGYDNAFSLNSFTADDFKETAKSITVGFGVWWEQECQAIKKSLISMESRKTGRIPLSAFYQKSAGGEWRFSESQAYLRELGALDESSKTEEPEVILPNYLLGTSNCIGTSTYYHVCCVNECESLMGEVERAVKGPVVLPKDVFAVVLNMTEEEDHGRFFGHLEQQLDRIAKAHRGKIPLHGRLFGQWMHRAFPRECPFPHRAGSVHSRTPLEFGEFVVTPAEIERYARMATTRQGHSSDVSVVDNVWGSELEADDEELLTDLVSGGSGGWQALSALRGGPVPVFVGAAVFFLMAIAFQDWLGWMGDISSGIKDGSTLLPRQKVIV